jgi:predicted nucleic acid-binding protein
MLFIYLLDDHPVYGPRVLKMLDESFNRKDQLLTSYLAVGETVAGAFRDSPEKAAELRRRFDLLGFGYLPFDEGAVDIFGTLRSQKVKIADAIHLASAGSAGVDLFLTGDRKLLTLRIPGIHFIADFDTALF